MHQDDVTNQVGWMRFVTNTQQCRTTLIDNGACRDGREVSKVDPVSVCFCDVEDENRVAKLTVNCGCGVRVVLSDVHALSINHKIFEIPIAILHKTGLHTISICK